MTSIDDFGTGYSNLRYLKHFKISFIKIDRSFIKNIDINNEDRAIVIAITQLAHSLNMKIIAEGIETEDILNQISSIGCDYAQGYFWSKPIPLNSFIDVLTRV